MTEFVAVAATDEIPPGTGKQVLVEGAPVAVFNVAGEYHAVEGICLHRGGPIGEGDLEDRVVTCPWHGYQYDVTTGKLLFAPEAGLRKHDVKIVDGVICVALAS